MITAMIGNYYSVELNARYVLLKKLNYLLDEISVLIRYKSATVYEILSCLNSDERFKELEFIKIAFKTVRTDVPFNLIWENAVDSSSQKGFLKEDYDFIKTIGMNLGNSDSEGQQSSIMLEKEELSTLIESAKSAYITKAKLYRTMGVLSGAFISILII